MRIGIAACFALLLAGDAWAQDHFALEILRPLATGAAGTGLDAANRVYRAYQGMPYVIDVTARGGQWPYTYSLTGAPTGMSVEAGPCSTATPACTAGRITWTDPQTTDSDITIQVCDVDLDCVTATWGVTVETTACTSAGGWCFVDGDVADGGDGSIGNPYNTIADVWNSSTAADRVMVLRGASAAYGVTGMTQTTPGDCDQQVAWSESTRPVIWIAYPGESVTIDFDYDSGVSTSAPCMELTGQNIWLDGFSAINVRSMAFQVIRQSQFGIMARALSFDGLLFGRDGGNSAFIMWVANYGGPSYGDTVTRTAFDNVGDAACALKVYSVGGGVFDHLTVGASIDDEAMLAMKAEVAEYTVRASSFNGHPTGIGGNMNGAPTGGATLSTNGEIYHNLFLDSGTGVNDGAITLGVAKVNTIGRHYVYRNTLIGKLNIANMVTADGSYDFTDNVIVNDDAASGSCPAKYVCTSVTDYTRLVRSGNIDAGTADAAVDASGNLQGAYLTHLGTKGYQLSGSGGATGGIRLRRRGE